VYNPPKSTFKDKINKSLNLIQSIVGLPVHLSLFKKYMVDTTKTFVPDDGFAGGSHSLIEFPESVK
jgi:hypothetical protein